MNRSGRYLSIGGRTRWGGFLGGPITTTLMIRALAALAAALPTKDSDRPAGLHAMRLALLARNLDFQRSIINADSALQALIAVQGLGSGAASTLSGCSTREALVALERYGAAEFRARRVGLGPSAWGKLLDYRSTQP